jgi:hypothetical protein
MSRGKPPAAGTDPARAGCPSADPGSAERPRPRSRGRGTFGRGLPSIGTTERRAGRLADTPAKTNSDTTTLACLLPRTPTISTLLAYT